MTNFREKEQGFTQMELIVVIVILGIALPSIFSLAGMISVQSIKYSVIDNLVVIAEEKIEEIISRKEAQWDWYKDPTQFEVDEDLEDGYHRTVTVTALTNWGKASIDAWEAEVKVTHPQFPDGFALVVRLTKYHQ